MLVIKPEDRIHLPEILCHPWLKHIIGPDGLPIDGGTEDDDDADLHDFHMSLSFQRQECNLNPLSVNMGQKTGESALPGEITERCRDALDSVNPHRRSQQAIGNINNINIANLFKEGEEKQGRLSYVNYCAVTQDFNTYHIEEEALRVLESFGYSRQHVISSLNMGELNHATCSYNLLVHE
jgi:hypothetical protein